MVRISSVPLLVFLNIILCESSTSTFSSQENNNQKMARLNKLCTAKYTSICFLVDLCKMIDSLSVASNFQILPGVFVLSNRSTELSMDACEKALFSNKSEKIHIHVRQKLQTYLDSLSINWKIMDRNSVFSVRQLGDDIITELLPSTATARGKKKNGKESVMWAAGAMAALGTSALFVITGKAAVASLAALMLSLLCYFKGSGHSGYTAATQAAYATPYKHQCTEAIIDVNGRGDHSATLMGYKKRTAEDNSFNYQQRYAPTMSDST